MADNSTKPKAPRPKPNHPTFLVMATEAITTLAENTGSSVPKIRTYIVEKYNIEPELVRKKLKPALAKGLEQEIFLRPKNSDAKGYTGRFKLNKAKAASEEKEKAKKLKEKAKKEKEKEKEKGKVAKKKAPADKPKKTTKTAAKSPKAKKASTAKDKPAKKVPKTTAVAKAVLKTPKKVSKKLKLGTPKVSTSKARK